MSQIDWRQIYFSKNDCRDICRLHEIMNNKFDIRKKKLNPYVAFSSLCIIYC